MNQIRNYTLIVAIIFLFFSCQKKEKVLPDLFNPNLNISVEDLKDLDFHFIKNWSMYNYVTDSLSQSTAYMYQCFYDKDPVLNRIIDIVNWTETDSIYIANWIDKNNGILISELSKTENDIIVFYAAGKSTGQISKCEIWDKHFTIKFYFPDTDLFIRSKYRKTDSGRFYTEIDVDGKNIIYQSDGVLGVSIVDRPLNW